MNRHEFLMVKHKVTWAPDVIEPEPTKECAICGIRGKKKVSKTCSECKEHCCYDCGRDPIPAFKKAGINQWCCIDCIEKMQPTYKRT
jgi:hypothetical protein